MFLKCHPPTHRLTRMLCLKYKISVMMYRIPLWCNQFDEILCYHSRNVPISRALLQFSGCQSRILHLLQLIVWILRITDMWYTSGSTAYVWSVHKGALFYILIGMYRIYISIVIDSVLYIELYLPETDFIHHICFQTIMIVFKIGVFELISNIFYFTIHYHRQSYHMS